MRATRVRLFPLIWLTTSAFLASTTLGAQDRPAVEEERPTEASVLHLVQFADGYLSVKVEGVSLHALLDEIANQSGLAVVRYSEPDERVTLEFYQLPLREGLQRILRHRSFVLQYARRASAEQRSDVARPKTLWLLSQITARSSDQEAMAGRTKTEFSADPDAAAISRLRAALDSADPEEREEAAAVLGETEHVDAVAPLGVALSDDNAHVRETAIVSLGELGGTEAAQALGVALRHEDPRVREQAVDALLEIGGDTAIGLLEGALADDEAFVREAAAEALEELSGSPR